MTAHRITRVGMARVRGEHLQAANDHCCGRAWSNEGRLCEGSMYASRRAARAAFVWCATAGAVLGAWTLFYAWLTA
jgi:hypothetical protein